MAPRARRGPVPLDPRVRTRKVLYSLPPQEPPACVWWDPVSVPQTRKPRFSKSREEKQLWPSGCFAKRLSSEPQGLFKSGCLRFFPEAFRAPRGVRKGRAGTATWNGSGASGDSLTVGLDRKPARGLTGTEEPWGWHFAGRPGDESLTRDCRHVSKPQQC